MDLQDLGFTKEELQERVIEQLARKASVYLDMDEDGNEIENESKFSRDLNAYVKKQVDASIAALAEKHVLPNVATYIENLCLQETNKWGEKSAKKMTFVEYLVSRAEAYMTEQVDFQGKTKAQDSYNWKGAQSRLTHLVHEHLHYSISTAMKEALTIANNSIAKGIQETVRLKLEEVAASLKVNVSGN